MIYKNAFDYNQAGALRDPMKKKALGILCLKKDFPALVSAISFREWCRV